jgi:Icc-related predicted phosphoesterase
MRVYAVADIHGKNDRFERIRDNLSDLKADILILAGDITNYTKPGKILSRLNALPVPVLVIRGNSDLKRVDRLFQVFPNCIPLHAVCTMIKSIPFVGISGTLPIPFRSRICLNEESNLKKIESLVNTHTVLVTHTPPRGYQDLVMGRFHAGSNGLLKLIKKRRPQIMICGHIHEDGGMSTVGKTRVVNCALSRTNSGALIVFENGNLAGLEMI